MCHHNKGMKQKFIFLYRQARYIFNKLTLRQIIKVERKIIQIKFQTLHELKVLANIRNNLIILVFKNQYNISDHVLMNWHNCKLKAIAVNLLT